MSAEPTPSVSPEFHPMGQDNLFMFPAAFKMKMKYAHNDDCKRGSDDEND